MRSHLSAFKYVGVFVVLALICARGGLRWVLGEIPSLTGLPRIGIGCTGKWWSRCPWRCLKDVWMWHLGTWFSGGLGRVGLMVGLNDLKGLFQPK